VKYITATFLFLVFNASWQWWALMCAWMLAELYMYATTFWKEYKKQLKELNAEVKPMTKQQLEEVWNNGYAVGLEHSQLRKH
jgi:hypothetical protein